MHMREQWQLHCTSQWGRQTPLSERVYCVAVTFKTNEQVQQWIGIKFCTKLEHSSMETIRWLRRPQLWTTGDRQVHHDNAPAHELCLVQSCLVKHQITHMIQPCYSPDLAPCDFWLFPTLKSPLKEMRFQTTNEIRRSRWWWSGDLCEVPQCLL